MSCDSCYNGCVETVSDQCVRFTGLDSVPLDIQNGDNLQTTLENIINNLVPLLTGEGDKILLIEAIRCALIDDYLPGPTIPDTWTSAQIFEALTKSVCALQAEYDIGAGFIFDIEAPYTTECLTVVPGNSVTHQVLQATIDKLCTLVLDVYALELDLNTNYVKLADFDALVAAYLASLPSGSTQQSSKMVPFVAYEYYGSLDNFDGTGAGIPGNGFYKVYLCNGLNGTPDKRGRVAVGAIVDVPPIGIGLDPAVNPSNPANPNYALLDTDGSNSVVLVTPQLPAHSHTSSASTSVSITDPGHAHFVNYLNKNGGDGNNVLGSEAGSNNRATTSATTGISATATTIVQVDSTGSGEGHANIQPVIAAYYIMYIP